MTTQGNRREHLVWLGLLLLTLVGFFFTDRLTAGRSATTLLLGIASLKSILIGAVFMELAHAHLLWKALMSFLLVSMLGSFLLFL